MAYNKPTANQISLGSSTNLDQVINSAGQWIGSPTGLQGPTGAQGANGSNGAQGATGIQGSNGSNGAQGIQGITGAGTQGATGLQGIQGRQGATGSSGPSTTINATASAATNYLVGVPGVGTNQTAAACTSVYMDTSTVYATDFAATSDSKFKYVVGTVPCALDKIKQMRGVEFYWNDEARRHRISDDTRVQVGLIAQEIEKIYPSLVNESNGNMSVAYAKVVSILIEAVKELSDKIDNLNIPK